MWHRVSKAIQSVLWATPPPGRCGGWYGISGARSSDGLTNTPERQRDMKKIQCIIYEDNGQFVAHCLNTGVATQGDTYEEAVKNIKEAVELYLEDDDGTFI